MIELVPFDQQAAQEFIAEAVSLQERQAAEAVLRENLISYLPRIFPSVPSWVRLHTHGAEAAVDHTEFGIERRSFIDNLVGRTSIEYERDLTSQLRYCALACLPRRPSERRPRQRAL